MKKRVADIVVDTLVELGIKDCFSVVGGGAMHLNNAFALKKDKIRTIYTHHEQAGSMAAEGYARLSGKMAAVCVTSGPGGTNAINGVQGAWVDSLPMIVISGHPRYSTTVPATGLKLRVRGVQENDIVAQVSGITKYAKTILEPETIKYEIQKAISIALDGRRGPVWIDIPLDVQGSLVELSELKEYDHIEEEYYVRQADTSSLEELQKLLDEAERPCILTGSGIRTGDAEKEYREFIKAVSIPIVGGSLQPDINYNGEKNFYGLSGTIGPRSGNFILQSADLIIVLGNSLSYKQTGHDVKQFAPNAKFVMVDAEEDEAKKDGLHIDLSIVADLKDFFNKCLSFGIKADASEKWFDHCQKVYDHFSKYEMLERHGSFSDDERVPVLLFWKKFMKRVQDNAVINLGNSSCVHGILQEGADTIDQRILVNYNCGSMGDDITEAMGSAAYDSEVPQYCVTGDGSLMMNIQEFQTIHHYNLPIKTVVMNNQGYGAIRATCDNFFNGLHNGCDEESGVTFPDFGDVAHTFKIDYRCCKNIGELGAALDWYVNHDGPCILEIYQMLNDLRGPRLESVMDENGVFYTPPLHILSPLLDENEVSELIYKE